MKFMFLATRKTIITRRNVILVTLLAVGISLGAIVLFTLRRAKTPRCRPCLNCPARGRRQVVWSPDGKTLAVVMIFEPFVFGKKERAIQLWDY
jgi:hypothetical protein